MGSNMENDRTVTTSKMYPIDLAPQKITIVKSVANQEVKMAHLISSQSKAPGTTQIITHTGPMGLIRPTAQIISTGISSQAQMIVSGSPIIQGPQLVSQGSQIISQGGQIITQPQLISSQILNQTQIISQGTQGAPPPQGNLAPVSGTQVLNVSGQIVGGTASSVVTSSVRPLSPSVRVIPPLPYHIPRPVNISNSTSGVVVSKGVVSTHVPRGPVVAASLAVPRVATRPIAPVTTPLPISSLGGGTWPGAPRPRHSLVYSGRAAPRTVTPRGSPAHTAIVTLPASTVLTSSGVITSGIRTTLPRHMSPSPVVTAPPQRALPLLQRNYHHTKVVGVAGVGVRAPVGNSAPAQLYYEVPRASGPPALPAPTAPVQVNVSTTIQVVPDIRASTPLARPSILRKRDIEGSPTKTAGVIGLPMTYDTRVDETELDRMHLHGSVSPAESCGSNGQRGSTTESAASSPAASPPPPADLSPRKKPRKQMLSSGMRQCEFPAEERTHSPPPAPRTPRPPPPPPKRPLLSSSFVCGWRATALHFTRPSDVRRREPKTADLPALASCPRVLETAQGWKVHHLTAQMDDLVVLESDVGSQLSRLLRSLEGAHGKAHASLKPHAHSLLELVKGNIQRSKIVCESIRESRDDVLRVFTHRSVVADILARQADKRSFRKHRSLS